MLPGRHLLGTRFITALKCILRIAVTMQNAAENKVQSCTLKT